MKIAIVGAGIIGVTTAWELASDGHEVSVFERRGAAAEEASFANAGVVAPGYVTPWAAPGMRAKVLRSLLSSHGAVKLRWPLSSRDIGWMSRWQKACKLETYLANRARMQRLAFYSRTRLHEVTEARELSYERSDGYLVLLRNPSVINLLDGCAVSIPCQAPGDAPVGLMLWHAAMHDDAVLAVALQAERALQK